MARQQHLERLTVAIPTYNRPEALRMCVSRLVTQLDDDSVILVVDNASATPASDALTSIIASVPESKVRFVRNPLNIGGNANIMRCFELCDTEWIWLLGDDDLPAMDAIARLRCAIAQNRDAFYINFGSHIAKRSSTRRTSGLVDLLMALDAIHGFSNLLFISAGAYRMEAIRGEIAVGFHYAYSCAPHLAMLFASIGDKGVCCLHSESIIVDGGPAAWSKLPVLLGVGTLLDLPIGDAAHRELAAVLGRTYTLRSGFFTCLERTLDQSERRSMCHVYSQVCWRLLLKDPRPSARITTRLSRLLFRALLRVPRISHLLYVSARRVADALGLLP